ncbi:MAG: hypothetical protein GXY58_19430 [Planctomycetaceae bacterium]|nr:hypothetical protein [Planctomycetaceae bacterium]
MERFLPLLNKAKVVMGLAPITPNASIPDLVCMKGYQKCTVIIAVDNGNTVTGSAITLKEATAVGGTDARTLAFSRMWANMDTDASDTLVEIAVASSTFTTLTTNNKNALYVIEIDADDLDMDNGFDCVGVGTANAANMVLSVVYILHAPRYAPTLDRSAIID